MKKPDGIKKRGFILTAALSVSLGFVSTASATTSWLIDPYRGSVIQLGSLGGDTYATDINDAGQVVGYSYTTTGFEHAFITGRNGTGMTDLGTLGGAWSRASGINHFGQVAGVSELAKPNPADTHAFITGPNGGGMRDLSQGSEFKSSATGINDKGQVAGDSQSYFDFGYGPGYGGPFYRGELRTSAFITNPNGVGMRDLCTYNSPITPCSAAAINNAGQVVGVAEPPPRAPLPGTGFITGLDGNGMSSLNDPYDVYIGAVPAGINNSGQVVGYMYSVERSFRFFFITGPNGMGTTELHILPAGINDTGEVVGSFSTSENDNKSHAFITGPNGVGATDLNSLVHMPEGVVLTEAIAINNLGNIIALSPVSPIPEPSRYALMLAGLALINSMRRRG